ncbi:hypothetical protein MAPG_11753 [Magnaporthiopsis poae ATCC 64411]|uniref:Uncharacterized protein n=1 Tax=Magnaporthiopsis poae (strain ATCC 64411 / 73-15) TaxID=644358 RepID=A0A0C4EG37_MAGP6|nr:hypothetical protein MAPG_11753 [Magnaporthiopsis poae ATCC 64411]
MLLGEAGQLKRGEPSRIMKANLLPNPWLAWAYSLARLLCLRSRDDLKHHMPEEEKAQRRDESVPPKGVLRGTAASDYRGRLPTTCLPTRPPMIHEAFIPLADHTRAVTFLSGKHPGGYAHVGVSI